MPTYYRHGPKKGQLVTLAGMLGSCEVCGAQAVTIAWDRFEIAPLRNYMGFWCRRWAVQEPGHPLCEVHRRPAVSQDHFKTDAEWEAWQVEHEHDEHAPTSEFPESTASIAGL